jgi:hypothetical protein
VPTRRPAYRELKGSPPNSSWDYLGRDALGCAALILSGAVAAAARTVVSSDVFRLDLPLGLPAPPLFGCQALRRTTFRITDSFLDDWVDGFYLQASTQWDGLGHLADSQHGWCGGRSADDVKQGRLSRSRSLETLSRQRYASAGYAMPHTNASSGSREGSPTGTTLASAAWAWPDSRSRSRVHRLVGQADLLHRGDEADSRHADPSPLRRDQHAEQAQRTHLAEQVGRTPGLLPRDRGTRGDLLLRELATEAHQIAFRLGEREIPRSDRIGPTGTMPGGRGVRGMREGSSGTRLQEPCCD